MCFRALPITFISNQQSNDLGCRVYNKPANRKGIIFSSFFEKHDMNLADKPPRKKTPGKREDPESTDFSRPGKRQPPAAAERTEPERADRSHDAAKEEREQTQSSVTQPVTNHDEQEKITN